MSTHTIKYSDQYEALLPFVHAVDQRDGSASKLFFGEKVTYIKSCDDLRDCIVEKNGVNYRVSKRNLKRI
jgi:hypothetical protein